MKHKFTVTCDDTSLPRLRDFLAHQSGQPNDTYAWTYEGSVPTQVAAIVEATAELQYTQDLSTENFTIKISEIAFKGYFEHNDLGDECAGELWFGPMNELLDYDGVFELPGQVVEALKDAGYFGDAL